MHKQIHSGVKYKSLLLVSARIQWKTENNSSYLSYWEFRQTKKSADFSGFFIATSNELLLGKFPLMLSLQVKILSHVDDFRMRIFAGREPELGILQVLVRAVSLHGEILFLTVLQFDADGNRLISGRYH